MNKKTTYSENHRRYYLAHKEIIKAKYNINKEAAISKQLDYYYAHKDEINRKQKLYRREHVISHRFPGGKTLHGINKSPRPSDDKCLLCEREGILVYHHWDDNETEKGLWCCNGCHMSIHKLLRMKNPQMLLAEVLKYKQIINKSAPSDSTACIMIPPLSSFDNSDKNGIF